MDEQRARGRDGVRREPVRVPFGTVPAEAEPAAVAMRDGVRLATDVYRPDAAGAVPAVLIRIPYDKTAPEKMIGDLAARLTVAGYAVVAQDVRGRIRSEGETVPFVHEVDDGYDTLEWISRQPWSDGTAAAWGCSYYGFTVWAALASGHPALRATVTRVISTEPADLAFDHGVFKPGPMVEWLRSTWRERATRGEPVDWSVRPPVRLLDGLPDGPEGLPYAAWPLLAPGGGDGEPDAGYTADRWRRTAFAGRAVPYGRVPGLHAGGWFDLFQRGQLADWARSRSGPAGRYQYLVMDATDHQDDLFTEGAGSPDHFTDASARRAMLDRTLTPVLEFLRRHLPSPADRGAPDAVPHPGGRDASAAGPPTAPPGADPAPVRWRSAGGVWRTADRWPLPSGTRTVRHRPTADGRLLADGRTAEPGAEPAEPVLTWRHDPADPVPATERDPWRPLLHVNDERSVEARPDVLVFTTAAAAAPYELAGPVAVRLRVESTAPYLHLVLKLCEVDADGVSRRLLVAARRVAGVERDAVVRTELGSAARRLPAGHRLRLQVAASCWPAFLPHSGTTASAWTAERWKPSVQRLHLEDTELTVTVLD